MCEALLYLLHPQNCICVCTHLCFGQAALLLPACPLPWCSTPVQLPFFKDMAASVRRLLLMANLSYNQFAIHRKFSLSLYRSCNLELPHCLCTFLHNQADATVDSGFLLHSSPLQCASCLCPSDTAFSKVTNNHSFAKLRRGFEVLILHDLFVALKIGDSGVSFLGFCAAS